MQNSHIHCKNLFANKVSVFYKEPTIFVEFSNVPFSALAGFLTRYLVELEFGDDGFCGGRKTGEPGEKPLEEGKNQQQTQPT